MKSVLLSTSKEKNQFLVTVETLDIVDELMDDNHWRQWFSEKVAKPNEYGDVDEVDFVTVIRATPTVKDNQIVLNFMIPDYRVEKAQLKKLINYIIDEVQIEYEPVKGTIIYDLINSSATFVGEQYNDD